MNTYKLQVYMDVVDALAQLTDFRTWKLDVLPALRQELPAGKKFLQCDSVERRRLVRDAVKRLRLQRAGA